MSTTFAKERHPFTTYGFKMLHDQDDVWYHDKCHQVFYLDPNNEVTLLIAQDHNYKCRVL